MRSSSRLRAKPDAGLGHPAPAERGKHVSKSAGAPRGPKGGEPGGIELEFFRLLNYIVEPRIRAGWGSLRMVPGGLIVLETTGRKSGRTSRVPLAALRIDEYVLVSTFRGRRSQWVKNVAAHPVVRYWLRGRPRRARALVISSLETRGTESWPAPVRFLTRVLEPYTYAGWAFAILGPERLSDPPATRKKSRPARSDMPVRTIRAQMQRP